MLNLLYIGFGAVLTLAGSLFAPEPQIGAALPQTPAGFETSLAAPISSSATTMTLTSATTRGGTALSGYNCFTIDAGSAQAEYVCGTVSGTTVSSMTRGIDDLTGTTTNATLQFSHRRGASVQITDFPAIQIIRSQNNGSDTFPNVLKYDASTPACGANNEICDYEFITGLAFSGAGVVDGTATAKGVLELATQLETASSSSAGSSGNLAIPASNATSTWNSATAPLRVVVTQNNGKIDNGFIATTTLFSVTPPTAIGASSTALFSNGSGGAVWDYPRYTLLAATTTTVTSAYATTTFTPGNFDNLFIVLVSDANTDPVSRINFNTDWSTNYAWTVSTDDGTPAKGSAASYIDLNGVGSTATSTSKFLTANIQNNTSFRKSITSTLILSSGTNVAPIVYNATGIWNNTSTKISSITFQFNGLQTGAKIYVYGY